MKPLGTYYNQEGWCEFRVWAPLLTDLVLLLNGGQKRVRMHRDDLGYFSAVVKDVAPGSKYFYLMGENRRADPASFFQPEDVNGPSAVVDHNAFAWKDHHWPGIELRDLIIYEIHIGTFTPEGTLQAAIGRLDDLADLGITAVEIMPVAQFPGNRNWGYDGVFPYAVQHSYGGPDGLKAFVDAAHQKGLAVILDVVYNHVGPEGNFLGEFMPFFTDHYTTPWGRAVNYDGPQSLGVREFVVGNALYWLRHFHVDALRLDAVHGIFDMSAQHILAEMSRAVEEFARAYNRKVYLIAESDLNDRRVIDDRARGGYGIHAQWNDDFHHIVHALLTRENKGYYEDFTRLDQLAKALKEGFIYDGSYSHARKRHHGNSAADLPAECFVICIQNHDQIGNRLNGDRLSSLVSPEALKLAAGVCLLSPYLPLLFMGEEYGERAPFLYFMSFHDEKLIQAVREGRKREFSEFQWNQEPADPYAEKTFERCKLNWDLRDADEHQSLLAFYKKLIALRKSSPALRLLDKENLDAAVINDLLLVKRKGGDQAIYMVMNFQNRPLSLNWKNARAAKLFSSADSQWGTPMVPNHVVKDQQLTLGPVSFAVYEERL